MFPDIAPPCLRPIRNMAVSKRNINTGANIITVATNRGGIITAIKDNKTETTAPLPTSGLIDLQVNGFAGVDFNDENITVDDMDNALYAMLATGVTSCLPTLITAREEVLHRRMEALDKAVANSTLGPLMVPGYHLEGPFLNPKEGYAGCHPARDMTPPSIDLVKALEKNLSRPVLYITLAPELEGANDLISWASQSHKIVGAGHCAVTQETLSAAIKCGLGISTHLGNGVPQNLHKFNNSILWQLANDNLMASFIADGIHIPPDILKIFIRAKGVKKSILVTDGTSASCSTPGRHYLAGMASELNDQGIVTLSGSPSLAGSALSLGKAMANMVKWNITDFRSALRMASANPAELLAPTLRAHNITMTLGEIVWGDDFCPLTVNLGPCMYQKKICHEET